MTPNNNNCRDLPPPPPPLSLSLQQPLLRSILTRSTENFHPLYSSLKDQFELCLTKCRTSSQVSQDLLSPSLYSVFTDCCNPCYVQSVQHENSYRNPQAKYCYGTTVPVLLPEESARSARLYIMYITLQDECMQSSSSISSLQSGRCRRISVVMHAELFAGRSSAWHQSLFNSRQLHMYVYMYSVLLSTSALCWSQVNMCTKDN